MIDPQALFRQMYAEFNLREIDAVLGRMSPQVSWPKASEGGRIVGKEAIRAYWMRQWAEFNPHVEPTAISTRDTGEIDVSVHQVVRSLSGELLSDQELTHTYTVSNGLIERMDLSESEPAFRRPHSE